MVRSKYSRWDGSQEIFSVEKEELMDALSEELVNHGDVDSALRRLMQRGLQGPMNKRIQGMEELLRRLNSKRQELLKKYDLHSMVDDMQAELNDIVNKERQGIQKKLSDAEKGAGQPQASPKPGESSQPPDDLLKALKQVANRNLNFLDNLPPDLGGKVQQLSSYEFMDGEARGQFEEFLKKLKKSVNDAFFKDASKAMKDMSPEQIKGLKDMLKALNRMLMEKRLGGEPNFKEFMDKFGSYFGSDPPKDLEELIKRMQGRMSQMESLMDSLSESQKKELESLIDSMLAKEGLGSAMAELAYNLEYFMPMAGMKSSYPFEGNESVSMDQAMDLMKQLQELDGLKKEMGRLGSVSSVKDIDPKKVKDLLGEDAAESLKQMQHYIELLEEAGYVTQNGTHLELTARGMRRIGQKALRDIFSYMKKQGAGRHEMKKGGGTGDIIEGTKKYEYGDPFLLHLEKTLMNALQREGVGSPVKIGQQDFEVYQAEDFSRCTTVLMLDMSWSMFLRGKFTAAKKVALALDSLIRTQFPRDSLYLVVFSEYAREIKSPLLPFTDWNEYVYGTNMHHGFQLSRQLLAKHKTDSRQIIMVTDGEPTAHLENGVSYFQYPPSPRTLELTLLEAKRCAQEGIVINTFMLDRSFYMTRFMEQLTKINKGRVFFTSPEKLGEYLLVDYVSNKKRRIVA
ncbi:MAG: VWA domain-containing protein [Chloroflexi bacterium]|nr:VWA domain-containing protein [Chloroflexota bacterium]